MKKPTVEEAVKAMCRTFRRKYGLEARQDFLDAVREILKLSFKENNLIK
jgi:hypothetical protein